MKKYMDKLKCNIRINKNLFVFLLVIVLVGVVAGSLFTLIISSDDKAMVLDYLNSFFNNAKDGKLNYDNSLINSLTFTIGFAFLLWLLGISVVGFFIILFMLFLKGFILGFSISSILVTYKFKGILLSLVYVFPHQIINLFIFILLSSYALIISYKLIQTVISKSTLNFKNIINRYIIVLGFSTVILVFTSLYEIYGAVKLISFVMTI